MPPFEFVINEYIHNIYDNRYVECTSAAIQGLALFTQRCPEHRRMEIQTCIAKAANYIESIQLADGSWFAALLVHKLTSSSTPHPSKLAKDLGNINLNVENID